MSKHETLEKTNGSYMEVMENQFTPNMKIKWMEIESKKSAEDWVDDFIDWLESRNELCCGVTETIENELGAKESNKHV